ncbi:D-alanine--poly(phosphoribitol) ligase subunit DltA [Clostridium tagluense]|uniref:D-alanine--poly(phosphoribitol) ligase subunit DltA n=1 Tax=Clostridium tagluense TaxID=360422 RepID=UPI001CF19A1D|nr:D-alanine--poly(phosphoribitol) ligase subunit DltA [Clostridium tagluense]MCB2312260.1 D-alanine--poly(phosphoribitol) ligase subunit DltA [Clostridium tagluense]MCB2317002.1 D-alanine--poly(phosphoribitol) ligase subunit DltA [Clostridium tagluense]MCB2321798.1 D-alanine--poly(phosphoribitol) ligase subunit DltA [Clostridium tagluense]MCB2326781.1 D-alanine--poly(phosphoribitol) ligase subunit DltA [Clostridium tagluense]MCB2331594.1 D-alanine--poly(phosphoribitol) ligase subunit DltA [Cl
MNFIDIIESYCNTNKIAHIYKNSNLTYKELKTKSDSLAVNIIELFGEDKTPIIVFGHKDHLMLISFLACVKSGHAYIPVDSSTPSTRLKDILFISGAKLIINISDKLIDIPADTVLNKNEIEENALQYKDKIPNVSYRIKGEEVYYIIYTSGSTGKPKGVQITQNCIQSFIDWSMDLIDKKDKIFMNQAPFSFDLSVMDTYLSLVSGSILYSIDKEMIANLLELFINFKSSGITTWVSTPSFAEMCLQSEQFNEKLLPELRQLLFCGETLSKECVKKLFERFPKIKIINFYGPTEATVAVTAIEIKQEMLLSKESLPVGYVKKDCEIIIEENTNEILIVGDSVSIGYFADPILTKKSFFRREISDVEKRGYRTGDTGYIANGLLYYEGRIDNQIKLNGYRVEIEDIENNIKKLPFIKNAVVVPIKEKNKIKYLATVVVINDKFEGNIIISVKNSLKDLLPSYMIPRKVKVIEALPMNRNGKIDRKKIMEEF